MTIYTVLAPSSEYGAQQSDPMAKVFVKEGFCWPALFFAVPWLLFRKLWLVLVGYVLVVMALAVFSRETGSELPGIALFLVHFLFALEANELRRQTLIRKGYRLEGVVEGRGLEEAEIRFFAAAETPSTAAAVAPPPLSPPRTPAKLGPVQPSAEAGDVVGLFPSPGGAR